jgi:uncharacterized membrane protein YozB (DUF420 family)
MQHLYDFLKILHIILASILCITLAHDIFCWFRKLPGYIRQLQKHSLTIIIPIALIQLLLGFTMISLKHYDFHEKWILISVIGFPVFIVCWVLFVCFAVSCQRTLSLHPAKSIWMPASAGMTSFLLRHVSLIMLACATLSLLLMIFFMTNKIM